MSTKSELLKLLESHRGEYLSGEELASRLGYSRTAVWKAMKNLRQEGYRILAVNNRGYALETDNDILSVEAVKMHLEHRNVFMQVEKEISSTNQYLKKKGIEENLPHGSFVAAEAQTEGKGRRGRTFYSPAGSGLYLSVLMRPKRTAQESLTLTAAAAVAVCRAVEEVCGVSLGIKWVNDLYLGERKVCGILTEAVTDFETGDIELVVVGIGLNLRMPAGGFPGELSEVAGAILGDDVYVDRNLLTAGIINYLLEEAEKEGITNFPIHIKLDTGMHRLGFAAEDMPRLIERLKGQNAVIARSVFSHFVGSDAAQFDAFTRGQIEMFEAASMQLQEAFPHKILRHICNSAGIERFPGAQFDMVRLGIGLYGVSPIDNSIINNVSTLKTTILQIRDVPQEDTVGYSRKGHLTRNSRIAALPIGYADGLNRHLGNGHAYCLVNGQRAPYVGNICMDVCMIDVTDIDCKEGDAVEIFGDHLSITVLSDILETIPYEVLTSISTRVKRIYYQD